MLLLKTKWPKESKNVFHFVYFGSLKTFCFLPKQNYFNVCVLSFYHYVSLLTIFCHQMKQGYMRLQAMIRSRILTARFNFIRGWALNVQVR